MPQKINTRACEITAQLGVSVEKKRTHQVFFFKRTYQVIKVILLHTIFLSQNADVMVSRLSTNP
jgi:hypothetical protein